MDNFMIGFNAVMPMLMYMLIGQFLTRSGLIQQKSYADINRALFQVLLPLNLFTNVYNSNFKEDFAPRTLTYVLGYAILIFIVYALIVPIVNKSNQQRGVILQGSIRSNAILFGLPLGTALLGPDNLGLVSIVLATIVPFNNVLSVISLSIYSDTKVSFKQIAKNILTNPMVIFTVIGILFVVFQISLPSFVNTTLSNISSMVSPLALIVMGGTFSFGKIKDAGFPLYFTVVSKLLIVPVIALIIGAMLGFRDQSIVAILIATAGPTAVSSYAQALAAGGDGDLANQIVVFTTIGSMFSLVLFIYIMKVFGLF